MSLDDCSIYSRKVSFHGFSPLVAKVAGNPGIHIFIVSFIHVPFGSWGRLKIMLNQDNDKYSILSSHPFLGRTHFPPWKPVASENSVRIAILALALIQVLYKSHDYSNSTHLHLSAEVAACVGSRKPRAPSSTRSL